MNNRNVWFHRKVPRLNFEPYIMFAKIGIRSLTRMNAVRCSQYPGVANQGSSTSKNTSFNSNHPRIFIHLCLFPSNYPVFSIRCFSKIYSFCKSTDAALLIVFWKSNSNKCKENYKKFHWSTSRWWQHSFNRSSGLNLFLYWNLITVIIIRFPLWIRFICLVVLYRTKYKVSHPLPGTSSWSGCRFEKFLINRFEDDLLIDEHCGFIFVVPKILKNVHLYLIGGRAVPGCAVLIELRTVIWAAAACFINSALTALHSNLDYTDARFRLKVTLWFIAVFLALSLQRKL